MYLHMYIVCTYISEFLCIYKYNYIYAHHIYAISICTHSYIIYFWCNVAVCVSSEIENVSVFLSKRFIKNEGFNIRRGDKMILFLNL